MPGNIAPPNGDYSAATVRGSSTTVSQHTAEGGTIVCPSGNAVTRVAFMSDAALNALNVTLPAGAQDGDMVYLMNAGGAVTNCTITSPDGAGVSNGSGALGGSGSKVWTYIPALNRWHRVGGY